VSNDSKASEYMRLLRSDALDRISRLELIARSMVSGFITGRHTSPYKGASVEFAEHRAYVPGDNIRDLDWRVFGKSDRYYIKQYIEETNLRATILVDASASMKYTGNVAAKVDGRPVSKYEYARYLAASLTYLLINQQDAVGLVTYDTELRKYIPPRSSARHLRAVLQELEVTEPGGETSLSGVFHDIAERIHRRGLVIIISDLFDDEQEVIKALHHFRYRHHEVLLLHIMADEELTFPFSSFSDFRDLELEYPNAELDPLSIKSAYLEQIRNFVSTLEEACGQMEVDYVPMNTKTPFEVSLSSFLATRQRSKR
jgi:uncharacterized protein (DUF58 family)